MVSRTMTCLEALKTRIAIATFLIIVPAISGGAESGYREMEELQKAGRKWLETHPIDFKKVKRLESNASSEIRKFWKQMQERLQGEYVVDCAKLKAKAEMILSVLENIEEARPYAVWLKTRMDYFTVAEKIRVTIPPPNRQRRRKRFVPSASVQRRIWREEVEERSPSVGSQHYASQLKPIFVAADIPDELIWLAEVESSFNPVARSPVGAAGLFQFMPATARQYGLSLRPSDERLDPEKSARAAARYLRHLHSRFRSWPLALAAYNAGEGRVSRELEEYEGRTFEDIVAGLPAETQLYVPKIEATIREREGVELKQL